MKKIQRFLRGTALLAVLSLLVSATAFAASVPDPTSDFYVNDYVGVLSGDTKSDIVSKNDGLYNATGAQIVVTVVQDTGGVSMEQYAYDMANAWGIGSAEKNNGVLLLLSVGDDDYQCIQGSGLETLLPTSTLSRILQEDLEPDFADKNYDAGVKKTFASLYDAVSSIYGYDGSTGGAANPSPVPQPDYDYGYGYGYDDGYRDDGGFSIFGMIVFLVIVLALIGAFSGPRRPRRGRVPARARPGLRAAAADLEAAALAAEEASAAAVAVSAVPAAVAAAAFAAAAPGVVIDAAVFVKTTQKV